MLVGGNAEFLSDFVAQALGNLDGGFFVQNLRFLENSIDWMTLDNDMMEIRGGTTLSRKLRRTEKGTQLGIEAANYLIPAVLLLLLASLRVWRRRQVTSLATGAPTGPRSSDKEVTV